MIETIKEFFAAAPGMAWSIVFVMIAMVAMVALWEKLKWWWLNTWMSFPWFGFIASESKDLNRDTTDNAWFKAEKTLCGKYKKFIRIQDEHDFNEKIKYLTRAGDNGRTPMPTWIWVLTALLVFFEAMGFSYVLAGWSIPGASESLQQSNALGIAFLVSVVLVAFTHWAGRELYVTIKINNARREWAEDGRKHKLMTGVVAIANPQSTDDGQPAYAQLTNRVEKTHGSYIISGLTLTAVLLVAAGATFVRGEVLEKSLHAESVGKRAQMNMVIPANSDGLNMAVQQSGNPALPDADVAQNQATKDKAVLDEDNIDRRGGWGTFIVLAVIFVFLQILGVIFGYKWGFAGKNSVGAYRAIGGDRYTTYADVREHYKEIADAAQSKLESLQQKLMNRNSQVGTEGMHTTKTFYDYMGDSRLKASRDLADQREHTDRQAEASRQAMAKAEADRQALHQATVKPTAPVAEAHASDVPLSVDEAVRQLESLQSKDAKKDYVRSLPQLMQVEVLNAIKAAKEAEKTNAARAQLEAQMDEDL